VDAENFSHAESAWVGASMKINLSRVNVELGQNQTLPILQADGVKVSCLHGSLWITQDHDSRDVILEPGDAFVMDRKGRALVSALAPSGLLLEEPAPLWQRSLLSRLASLFGRWNRRIDSSASKGLQHPAIALRCY
jgi:hypothetical protein